MERSLGKSGHIVDMLTEILSTPSQADPTMAIEYCERGLDHLEREAVN